MISKVLVLALVAVAVHASGLVHTGSSVSSRHQDNLGNYAFNYDIVDGKGASNGRYEVGDGHGNKKGAYTIHDIDGRARRVEYVADHHGFRAAIKTNEPGTAASAPAAAVIASPYGVPVAPVAVKHVAPVAYAAPVAVKHVGPVVHAAHVAAPVYAAAPAHVGYATHVAHGAYGHGPYGHGAYGHGPYGHGAYGHGAYGHGAYGHGPYGHGVYGHGHGVGLAKAYHY
ncbi:adult-specific rigid cuticular protein 15.7 [Parasteatoda tepidariorum]|uniref:adult-specific rigid cuticular protein 15.7 n=1 Tax=Parasteatoda tepidariorum TaxID=114398 RepID=UPI00077FD474|nr:adult-specific rigid cuticular protein 15.7 [Parasteatoda tepidariorum]